MLKQLFESACLYVVRTAERAEWQPKAQRPVVRVCGDEVYDDRGNVVGAVNRYDRPGEGTTMFGHANVPYGPLEIVMSEGTDDFRVALDAVIAELSKWAEVDAGKAREE